LSVCKHTRGAMAMADASGFGGSERSQAAAEAGVQYASGRMRLTGRPQTNLKFSLKKVSTTKLIPFNCNTLNLQKLE
jgi:hypothetical protein